MRADLKARIDFITSAFGSGIVNKNSIAVTCPQCGKENSSKKKLVIKLDDGMHHCWVCDLKGRSLKYTVRKFAPAKFDEYYSIFHSGQKFIQSEEQALEKISLPPGFILLGECNKSKDPDIKGTLEYAKSRGITESDLWYFKLGTCKFGRFRRRLIMPSFDQSGSLNYYTARSIDSDKKIKYLNAKAPKKSLIFNESNIKWKEEITLVEGPMD